MEQILKRSIAILTLPSKTKLYQLCSNHWVLLFSFVVFNHLKATQPNVPIRAYRTLPYTILPDTVTFGVSCRTWLLLLKYFPINHLHNLSSYEIVYGHKPPAITDLQLEEDDLTSQAFYPFSDYLDLLNERIHAICNIVKEHHN